MADGYDPVLDPAFQHRTALYRAYDCTGRLLYVGIAKNWAVRWTQHLRDSPWAMDVTRLDIKWYPKRWVAMDVEKVVIYQERPPYNWAGNPAVTQR